MRGSQKSTERDRTQDIETGLAVSVVTYVGVRAGSGLLGFVALAAFSRLVSSSEFSTYALISSAALGLGGCLYVWLSVTLQRHLADRSVPASFSTSSALFLFLVCTGVLLGGAAVAAAFVDGGALVWCVVLTATGGVYSASLALSAAHFRRRLYATKELLRFALYLLLGVSLVHVLSPSTGLLLAHAAGAAAAACYGLRAELGDVARAQIRPTTVRSMLAHGLPISFALAMAWVVDQSDLYILLWLRGEKEAGQYALAYSVAKQPVWLLLAAAAVASLPHAAKGFEDGGPELARAVMARNLSMLLLMSLPVIALEVAFPTAFARFSVGQEYREVTADIMPIVAIAMLIQGLRAGYLDTSMHVIKRTRVMIGMWLTMAAVNVALNFALIVDYGSMGAAYATLAAHLTSVVYYIAFAPRTGLLGMDRLDLAKLGLATAVFVACFSLFSTSSSVLGFVMALGLATAGYAAAVLGSNAAQSRRLLAAALRRKTSRPA